MDADDSLFQVAYVSRRLDGLTNDEIIDGIVLPSMARNRQLEISGCIWFDDEFFFQVLEGRPSEVRGLYARIEKDGRHCAPCVFSAQRIGRRDFERFSMRLIEDATVPEVRKIITFYDAGATVEPKQSESAPVETRRLITRIASQFV